MVAAECSRTKGKSRFARKNSLVENRLNLRCTNRVLRELHATGRIELANQVQRKIILFNRIIVSPSFYGTFFSRVDKNSFVKQKLVMVPPK